VSIPVFYSCEYIEVYIDLHVNIVNMQEIRLQKRENI
jgi:hypothetical protein